MGDPYGNVGGAVGAGGPAHVNIVAAGAEGGGKGDRFVPLIRIVVMQVVAAVAAGVQGG